MNLNNSNKAIWKKGLIGAFVSILLIVLDQVTKQLAVRHLKGDQPIELFPGIFELRYLENQGAAFGILQNQKNFLMLMTLIVLAVIIYIYLKRIPLEKHFFFLDVIAVLFFAGAIGNFIDRMIQDYVVDFFYFVYIDFPIFNVADIYVSIAAFLLFILVLFYYKDEDFDKIFFSRKKEE